MGRVKRFILSEKNKVVRTEIAGKEEDGLEVGGVWYFMLLEENHVDEEMLVWGVLRRRVVDGRLDYVHKGTRKTLQWGMSYRPW